MKFKFIFFKLFKNSKITFLSKIPLIPKARRYNPKISNIEKILNITKKDNKIIFFLKESIP